MTENKSLHDSSASHLDAPALGQLDRQGEWIEPGADGFDTAPEPEVSGPMRKLRSVFASTQSTLSAGFDIARALPKSVQIVAAGVLGFAVLAVVRRMSRPPRETSRSGRPAREEKSVVSQIGRDVLRRAALAALTTAAARIARDAALPAANDHVVSTTRTP